MLNKLYGFFADDCNLQKKLSNDDMEKLQKDVDRMGEWADVNSMKINPSKSKAVSFT